MYSTISVTSSDEVVGFGFDIIVLPSEGRVSWLSTTESFHVKQVQSFE